MDHEPSFLAWRMAGGCGFENWPKTIGADGWQTDNEFRGVIVDEIIANPRNSTLESVMVEFSIKTWGGDGVKVRTSTLLQCGTEPGLGAGSALHRQ